MIKYKYFVGPVVDPLRQKVDSLDKGLRAIMDHIFGGGNPAARLWRVHKNTKEYLSCGGTRITGEIYGTWVAEDGTFKSERLRD